MPNINRTTATDPPRSTGARRQPRILRTGLLAGAILAAMLIAACGGSSSSSGVAHVNTSSTTAKTSTKSSGKPNPLAFAQCMRKHGLPNFPDPTSSGQLQLPNGLTTNSPVYQAAAKACGSLIGGETAPKSISQNPQTQGAALKLAQCMRSHGVPNFPDGPINKNSGINQSSPAFQRAFQKCGKDLSGSSQIPVTGGS
jgi:hypothetical protein